MIDFIIFALPIGLMLYGYWLKFRKALPIEKILSLTSIVVGSSQKQEKQERCFFKGKHVMVVGSTGKGKSSFVEYMLHHILQHNPETSFLIINPHHRKGQWGLPKCVGSERNYKEIEQIFPKILDTLTDRYKEYFADKDLTHAPLYIIIDELPAIAQNTSKDSLGNMLRQISSEGRKVNIFLILLTQSTMVKYVGFERASDMLENFIRVTVAQPKFTYATEIGGIEQERTGTFELQKVAIPEDKIVNCF